jgi:transcriptional regulator with XRE-family HTH domain
MSRSELGFRMAQARLAHGWTQKHVAELLGISQAQYAPYEHGYPRMLPARLARFAELVGVSVEWLERPTEENKPDLPLPESVPRHAMAAKTHCKHGHALTSDNIIVKKNGERSCRACKRIYAREYQRRKRAREREQSAAESIREDSTVSTK